MIFYGASLHPLRRTVWQSMTAKPVLMPSCQHAFQIKSITMFMSSCCSVLVLVLAESTLERVTWIH